VQIRSFPATSQKWNDRRDSNLVVKRTATTASVPVAVPYASLTVGIPRETFPNERRVAITPQNVQLLLKKGFSRVLVEHGAGDAAQFTDEAYTKAGATIVDRGTVWSQSDILLKVRAPNIEGSNNEAEAFRQGGTMISFLYPVQNRPVVNALASRGVTSFAMDKIPRISRAQVFDALRCARMCYAANVQD
jgi:NAD(P) transhydrogenase